MTRKRIAGRVAAGAGLLGILSCGGGTTEPPPPTTPPPPTAPVPARVTLDPDSVVVVAGETVRITARVLDSRALVISDAPVAFASSDPAVATVDASGLVTGVREGTATLTASSGAASAEAPMNVRSQDRGTLIDLYDATGGGGWTQRDSWGSDEPVGAWHGVGANSEGRVTTLTLNENGLTGSLPRNLGDLEHLTVLEVGGNDLRGPLPTSLQGLGITTLRYGGTSICTPSDETFRAWLNAVSEREGETVDCNEEHLHLAKLYEAFNGDGWTNSDNWLTEAPLGEWYGIETDEETGSVVVIDLNRNQLSGEIPPEIGNFPELRVFRIDGNQRIRGTVPPEIGNLTELRRMDIDDNALRGEIPPEFGNLTKLQVLWLRDNNFTGPLPAEFGNLTRLTDLYIYNNRFEGPLPEGIGNFTGLRFLDATNNKFSGPLPASIGNLSQLLQLSLGRNELSGAIPPEVGGMASLRWLHLQDNAEMAGPLPVEITRLDGMHDENAELIAGGTDLCVPDDDAIEAWAAQVIKRRIKPCAGEGVADAYLIQTAQSREYPVPLVAGRDALLRVFVASESATTETLPPVRATFFADGVRVHEENIPAGTSVIPNEVSEGELDLSVNADVPGEHVRPGLEMVVEVDPDGTLPASLGVRQRIPVEGRTAVDVHEMPTLNWTLVPFVYSGDNNREAVQLVNEITPEHERLWQTANLLPVGEMNITKYRSVNIDTNDAFEVLDQVGRLRTINGEQGHWMGLIPNPEGAAGVAYQTGKTGMSNLSAETIAHELGHNLSLRHADCGNPAGVDITFPWENARTGVWGYDRRTDPPSLVPPDRADLMSYCDPTWISDYYFTNSLRFRLYDEGAPAPPAARALLVSGTVMADGAVELDPAFLVEAPPSLPEIGGEHVLRGLRADGSELFSHRFGLLELWDGDGRSSFVFALPTEDAWASELAALEVSGPGGRAELRAGSASPQAILRDRVTGEVRGFRLNPPTAADGSLDLDALAGDPSLVAQVSLGLPTPEDWRR